MKVREFVSDFLQFSLRDATDQEHDELFLLSRNMQTVLGMHVTFTLLIPPSLNPFDSPTN